MVLVFLVVGRIPTESEHFDRRSPWRLIYWIAFCDSIFVADLLQPLNVYLKDLQCQARGQAGHFNRGEPSRLILLAIGPIPYSVGTRRESAEVVWLADPQVFSRSTNRTEFPRPSAIPIRCIGKKKIPARAEVRVQHFHRMRRLRFDREAHLSFYTGENGANLGALELYRTLVVSHGIIRERCPNCVNDPVGALL
jgi:hypothetical protein